MQCKNNHKDTHQKTLGTH